MAQAEPARKYASIAYIEVDGSVRMAPTCALCLEFVEDHQTMPLNRLSCTHAPQMHAPCWAKMERHGMAGECPLCRAPARSALDVLDEQRIFGCDKCHKFFYSKQARDTHYQVHTGSQPRRWGCPYCRKSFPTRQERDWHSYIGPSHPR